MLYWQHLNTFNERGTAMSIITATVSQGTLQGVPLPGYTVFKGVPYARPPVGDLRFKAPQPAESWTGIRMADAFSSKAAQMGQPAGSFYVKEFYSNPDFQQQMSEDSLYLNIWTPAATPSEKLPVAFWIHGGAFLGGSGAELEFDGEAYCQRGVILVTINYRVNAFGFLAHPWLSAENEAGISGNYGILDQIAALQWVHDNIAAFGGDPSKITIFGQSAGSMSVQTLLSTDLTGDLIHGAILQSGGGYDSGLNRDRTQAEAEEIGKKFMAIAGVSSLDELRALPAGKILEAAGAVLADAFTGGNVTALPFTPNIDGHLLKAGYNEIIDRGLHKNIPYMIGSTKNDIAVDPAKLAAGDKGKLYTGCINWSLKNEKLGRAPAYVYYFTRDLPGDDLGAFHSAELWYMFGTLNRCWRPMTDADHALSVRMLDYWCNFIKTGSPNAASLPDWQPCTAANPHVEILDV